MENRSSSVEVNDAKVETAFGKCGLGSCRSSCCSDESQQEPPELKQIRVAIRVELAQLEKLILDKMTQALKEDGALPAIQLDLGGGAATPVPLKRTLSLKVVEHEPPRAD